MKKTSFLLVMAALIFLASVCTPSFAILIQREEEKRDPSTGYSPAPGESFSYAYQYGEYDPETQKYYNIYHYPNWDWVPDTGDYDPDWEGDKDEYHPEIKTIVWYWYNGEWIIDTYVRIKW